MADRVKGIKIEIDGDTQGLDKALKSVNDKSVKLNQELKDVNKLLKFDPGNAELVAQKQKLLSEQVENTKTKLNALKQAQSQVEQQFQKGEIDEGQYRNFQREVASTEQSLRSYESQLKNLESSQTALSQNTKRLETFFEASKTSVDDYADILGNKLTQAIKGGYANADQLEVAINKIGREFTDSKSDIAEFKNALDGIDSGSSIDEIRNDLEKLRPSADEASESMDDLVESVTQGNMMQAGEIISGLGDKIVDLGGKAVEASLQYQQSLGILKANTTLSKQELEQLGGVAQNVFKSGVTDSIDEATQATALMKQSFGDLNNQQLTQLTEQVITLSQRTGTDVNENVRAASKLMQAFGMDAQSAFDLVASGYQNGLNKSGDYLDTVDEYSIHFKESGYTAQEMFSIIDNGMKNGAQNTDKAADSIKELKNKLGDGSFEKVMGSFSQSTQDAFMKWKENKATVKDVAASIQNDLKKMTPNEQQAALSSISTQFEDLGRQATSSLFDIKGGFDDVKGAMDAATESDPSQKWQSTWNEFAASMQQIGTDVLTALQPVLDFVSRLMEAFGNLPAPVRIFIEVITGLVGVFALLAPIIASIISIFTAISGAATAAGVTIGGFITGTLLPIIGVIAAVIAAVTAVILVIKNWGKISEWLKGVWEKTKSVTSDVWNGIVDFLSQTWDSIKQTTSNVWNAIANFFSNVWNNVVSVATSIFTQLINVFTVIFMTIQSVIEGIWLVITSLLQAAWNLIVAVAQAVFTPIIDFFENIWNSISNAITSVWTTITTYLTMIWTQIVLIATTIWTPIADFLNNLWNMILASLSAVWNIISTTASTIFNALASALSAIWETISSVAISVWNTVFSTLSSIWNSAVSIGTSVWNDLVSILSSLWNSLIGIASSAFNAISNTISNIFNGIRSTATSVWNGIKSAMVTPVEAAKNTISGIISSIKGFFNGIRLKLPKIEMPPLPHFSIKGKFGLNPPSVPHLSVDWYAKGGILTRPTVFGMNGNSLMVGGEAGKEAVAPLSDLMDYVRQAVAEQNQGSVALLAQAVELLSVIAQKDTNAYLDGKLVTARVTDLQSQNDLITKLMKGERI